jgi:hypothetical protein
VKQVNRPANHRENAAALIIVLAFVVLVTALALAYLSRTTTDRTVAHSSFNKSSADQLAASAADIVIGDLRQEILDPTYSTVQTFGTSSNPYYLSTPTNNANMVPMRSGNPATVNGVDPIPNLVRRSMSPDNIVPPGLPSRASAVNSTTDPSANGRSISLARWNKHYLIPRHDTSITIDSTPISPLASPIGPGDSTGFTPPDWVVVSRSGPASFNAWDPDLADTTKDAYVIGRYAYAVYDEGGLLDVNVAGYPFPSSAPATYATDIGRKGVLAFADLTALPTSPTDPTVTIPSTQANNIVGWRNFATTQQPGSAFPNFSFTAATTTLYDQFVIGNTSGFMQLNSVTWSKPGSNPNPRTDQVFITRQQLMNFRSAAGFSQNGLQYLSTFSRETISPSFSPSTPTVVNPNFLLCRVQGTATAVFTRFDNTPANGGEPLVKSRFPLSRLAWITYKGPSAVVYAASSTDPAVKQLTDAGVTVSTIQAGTAANIRKCFGLVWDSRTPYVPASGTIPSIGQQWVYVSPSSSNGGGNFDPVTNPTGDPASSIKGLDTVASENREPDFFELLRATILDGSLGQNTAVPGTSTTGVTGGANVFPDIHMNNKDHHVLSIGAAIIDQADPDSVPTRIQFKPPGAIGTNWWTAYGIESLPYVTQIYPISGFSPATGNTTRWATYLLFQLSNPHNNNGLVLSPAAPPVRLRVDGNAALFTGGNGQTYTTATDRQIMSIPAAGRSIAFTAGAFAPSSTPSPAATPGNVTSGPAVGSAVAPCGFEILPPRNSGAANTSIANYVGLRLLPDYTLTGAPSGSQNPQVMLYLGTDATHPFNVTMEFDAGGGNWVPYSHFIGLNDRTSWINGATLAVRTANNLAGTPSSTIDQFNTGRLTQSPPYCLMKADPRSTRFGIFQMDTNPTSTARLTELFWPTGTSTSAPNGYGGAAADGIPPVSGNPLEHVPLRFAGAPYYPATLCINDGQTNSIRNTATTSYADNDGIVRPGDAAYPDPTRTSTGSSTPWSSYTVSGTTLRPYWPIIVNRPFRSVAELGYAFRDLPWKSLDLFSDKSADAGLLDVFCIADGAPVLDANGNVIGMAEPAVVAGSLNLNTRQAPSLKAILAGTIWDELNSSNSYPKSTAAADSAQTMAPLVVSATSSPLRNRSELVFRTISPTLPNQILPVYSGATANQTDQLVKAQREAVARALASVTQTRTWNLMIDVIAQSGRYPPNAASGPNTTNPLANFIVEGEQRYWVHVAIDRFTGEVIDRQIEVVKE